MYMSTIVVGSSWLAHVEKLEHGASRLLAVSVSADSMMCAVQPYVRSNNKIRVL